MGHAADFALGLAIAQPERRVLCINGDGSTLMSLGVLVTLAQRPAPNLTLVITENGTYEVTGSQPVPGAAFIDYEANLPWSRPPARLYHQHRRRFRRQARPALCRRRPGRLYLENRPSHRAGAQTSSADSRARPAPTRTALASRDS